MKDCWKEFTDVKVKEHKAGATINKHIRKMKNKWTKLGCIIDKHMRTLYDTLPVQVYISKTSVKKISFGLF